EAGGMAVTHGHPPPAFYAPAGEWPKMTTGRIRSRIRRAADAPAARSGDGRRDGIPGALVGA
ncbi:MAG TPA: hypothetical protein VER37_03550, partial [Thermomicrobiales bacterium]|nr:hypothetical protein [Thermomicrobiales bacterium]